MSATQTQVKKLTKAWSKLAESAVEVEELKGTFYAYGSELAVRRIHYAYKYAINRAVVNYSTNLETWYFRLEPSV